MRDWPSCKHFRDSARLTVVQTLQQKLPRFATWACLRWRWPSFPGAGRQKRRAGVGRWERKRETRSPHVPAGSPADGTVQSPVGEHERHEGGPPGQTRLSCTGQAWGSVVLSREAHCQGRRETKTGKPKGLGKERWQETGKGGMSGRDSVSLLHVRVVCVDVGRQDTTRAPRAMMAGARPLPPHRWHMCAPTGSFEGWSLAVPQQSIWSHKGLRLTKKDQQLQALLSRLPSSTRRFLTNPTPFQPLPRDGSFSLYAYCAHISSLWTCWHVPEFISSHYSHACSLWRAESGFSPQNLLLAWHRPGAAWTAGSLTLTSPCPSDLHPYGVV